MRGDCRRRRLDETRQLAVGKVQGRGGGDRTAGRLTYCSGEGGPDLEEGEVNKVRVVEDLLCSDDGKDDHENAQAENTDEPCLLLHGYAHVVNEPEGHGHDFRT